ncbi:MAG: hypothetical protein ACD_54C01117G0002 [uncultured bacterium]|nr:MAG: hypothetical protein ACD_54C01117G0002 [uncultured bacterium]
MPGQGGGGIDVEWRADGGGNFGQRDIFGVQGAVAVKEMVHAAAPFEISRLGYSRCKRLRN